MSNKVIVTLGGLSYSHLELDWADFQKIAEIHKEPHVDEPKVILYNIAEIEIPEEEE